MKVKFEGKEVKYVIYEENGKENGLTIIWKDGNITECEVLK